MGQRKRRKFTDEQKRDAIELAKQVGNVSQVARDLDISRALLAKWIKQAEIDDAGGGTGALTTEEREELRKLKREVRTLRMERDFLKKAAAFFAEDSKGSS